jgi:hypothetical protein
VAQLGDQIFQVQSDDRLVLDDQHLAGQLAVDGLLGAQNGGFDLFGAFINDEGGLFQAEGLDGGQQQGSPLGGRQRLEARFRGLAAGAGLGCLVEMLGAGLPDGVEQAIQADPGGGPPR